MIKNFILNFALRTIAVTKLPVIDILFSTSPIFVFKTVAVTKPLYVVF